MIINTAFSDKFIMDVSKLIFEPTVRGESVFCRFFPGHGRSVRLQQIFLEEKFLKAGFAESFNKFVIVRVDASDFAVDPLDHFFQYVRRSLITALHQKKIIPKIDPQKFERSEPLIFTIAAINRLCLLAIQKGYQVLFVIEVGNHPLEKDREFYSAWAKVVEQNLDKIHTHIDSETRTPLDKGVLPAVLIQSIIDVPLPDREECDHYINYYLNLWKMKLTISDFEKIYEICGHDTWFIKESLRILHQGSTSSEVLYNPNLLLKARLQWELYSQKEKEVIAVTLKTGKVPRNLEGIALDLESVNFWDSKRRIPRIIEQVIIQEEAVGELSVEPKGQRLYLGSVDLSQKLTPLEHKILTRLYEQKNRVVKREEVAKIIWGKDEDDRYSDWAIDKTISRLRQKLDLYTNLYRIITKKKSGFMLEA